MADDDDWETDADYVNPDSIEHGSAPAPAQPDVYGYSGAASQAVATDAQKLEAERVEREKAERMALDKALLERERARAQSMEIHQAEAAARIEAERQKREKERADAAASERSRQEAERKAKLEEQAKSRAVVSSRPVSNTPAQPSGDGEFGFGNLRAKFAVMNESSAPTAAVPRAGKKWTPPAPAGPTWQEKQEAERKAKAEENRKQREEKERIRREKDMAEANAAREAEEKKREEEAEQMRAEEAEKEAQKSQEGVEKAHVEYDYPGTDEGELPASAGDIVTIVERDDSGWWLCAKDNGEQGYLPENYLKIVAGGDDMAKKREEEEKKREEEEAERKRVEEEAEKERLEEEKRRREEEERRRIEEEEQRKREEEAAQKSQEGVEKAHVEYDYPGTDEGELPASAGDIVTIVERDDSGWWLCAKDNGEQGYLPENYLKIVAGGDDMAKKREEEEKKREEEEAERKRLEEAERKRLEKAEKKRLEEEKRKKEKEEAERKRLEEEKRRREEEERRKREEAEKKRLEEEKRKKEEAERKRLEEEKRRREEEERRRIEEEERRKREEEAAQKSQEGVEKAHVEYDYPGTDEGELPASAGDIVTIVERDDSGWWLCAKDNGEQGYLPENYLKIVAGGDDMAKKREEEEKKREEEEAERKRVEEEKRLEEEQKKNDKPQIMANALYDYAGTDDNELPLKQGDSVTILEQDDGGWWLGEVNGKSGYFPSNFVELATAPNTALTATVVNSYEASGDGELSINKGDTVEVLEQDDSGWWLGKVGSQEGYFPSNFVAMK